MDASKLKAIESNTPQLYSLLNDKEYSINTIPEIKKDLLIPLEVMIKSTGEHTLALKELENYFDGLNLFNAQGELVANLDLEDYTFNAEKGETVQLLLGFSQTVLGVDERIAQNVFLTIEGSMLNINRLANQTAEILVHNVNGQCVYRRNIQDESCNVEIKQNGIYIVNVRFENGSVFNGKAIINF